MGGSGGGGAPTQSTTYTSNLPEYARPYFENLMDRTKAESERGYTAYPGPRVAGFSTDQQSGFGVTRDTALGGAPDIGRARDAAGSATNAALGTTGFQSRDINVGMFDGNAANRYMSPYMDAVVDRQKDAAVRDFAEGQGARNQSAIASGAFGGYRDAISRGVAERGLQNRLADIDARGRQSAFENAQAQFERDRSAGFTADATNESNRRGAAGVQQQGAALGLQGANTFANLAASDQGLAFARGDALQRIGAQQQAQAQRGLDIDYDNFVNQRDFERNQLNFYGGILRGVPVNAQQEVRQYQNPNPMNQFLGLGVAGLGAYNQFMR